jgi:hypothetical protein
MPTAPVQLGIAALAGLVLLVFLEVTNKIFRKRWWL